MKNNAYLRRLLSIAVICSLCLFLFPVSMASTAEPPASGSGIEIESEGGGRIVAPTDCVVVGIHATYISFINWNVAYNISLENAADVLGVELTFEFDGGMLSAEGITGRNGFEVMDGIHWTYLGNSIWQGNLTLSFLPGSDLAGFTSTYPINIASIVFTPRIECDAAVTLTSVKVTGKEGDSTVNLDAIIKPNVATVEIERIYSKYDLNKDGKVDSLDLGIMLLYCGFTDGTQGWGTYVVVSDIRGKPVTANMCDVNNDGRIDMLDLLDLFIHYGVPGDLGMVPPDTEISYGVVNAWVPGSELHNPEFSIVNGNESTCTYPIVGRTIKWYETTYGAWSGTKYPFMGDFASVSAFADYVSGKDTVGALVEYKLDSDSQIFEMKTGLAMTDGYSLTMRSRTVANVYDRDNLRAWDFLIDKGAAVFYCDSNGVYRTSTIANINLADAVNLSGPDVSLLFSEDGRTIVAMLLHEDVVTVEPDKIYGVVNKVSSASSGGSNYST
ncbi:MAG: dockerin type I domain-containing protein, partial [Clostridiales bacterium]|nr:dockerin type I domain-containing protein [Clostridiales bacterium]